MPNSICMTCGTQFAETSEPPAHCPICEDERQYVGHEGQRWTTLDELRKTHRNRFEPQEPGLTGIGTEPGFAIGQRALLVQTPEGNLLWDCLSLLDEATARAVLELGGVAAIAVSHPHYYSSMVEWAHTFGAPIYLHGADKEHVMRPDTTIRFWSGEAKPLFGGLTLIRAGGHFDGGTVLHWPHGQDGRGVLLSGDILTVVQNRRWVSFMYSYPNLIPLSAVKVTAVARAVEPFAFDRLYGAWWPSIVAEDAKAAVARSAARYLRALA